MDILSHPLIFEIVTALAITSLHFLNKTAMRSAQRTKPL